MKNLNIRDWRVEVDYIDTRDGQLHTARSFECCVHDNTALRRAEKRITRKIGRRYDFVEGRVVIR